MLKVNFKPIWPEATAALALLAGRYPEQVWSAASRQLLAAATRGTDLFVTRKPDWAVGASGASGEVDLVFDEQALRDWHLEDRRAKLRRAEHRFEGNAGDELARTADLVKVRIQLELFRAI